MLWHKHYGDFWFISKTCCKRLASLSQFSLINWSRKSKALCSTSNNWINQFPTTFFGRQGNNWMHCIIYKSIKSPKVYQVYHRYGKNLNTSNSQDSPAIRQSHELCNSKYIMYIILYLFIFCYTDLHNWQPLTKTQEHLIERFTTVFHTANPLLFTSTLNFQVFEIIRKLEYPILK